MHQTGLFRGLHVICRPGLVCVRAGESRVLSAAVIADVLSAVKTRPCQVMRNACVAAAPGRINLPSPIAG